MRNISASTKLKAVKEVLKHANKLSVVSQKYGCSRQTLYLWIQKYKKDPSKAGKLLENGYKRGHSHHKALPWKVEKLTLDLVVKYPDLNVHKLCEQVRNAGFKISVHGIYNILLRYELQTKELRHRFSLEHPVKTLFATALSPAYRAKIVDEYLNEGKSISRICKIWKVSRPTFYEWLKRYREVRTVEALLRRYKRGYGHHRSINQEIREKILEIVRENPVFSAHKIHAAVPIVSGRPIVGHHGIQNLLERESLNTIAKRHLFAEGYSQEPQVQVAPLYEVPVPRLSLWRLLFAPFATVPKWVIKHPASWPIVFPTLAFLAYIFEVDKLARPQMFFPIVALFFGFVFFLYSLKYYISLIIVMRLAQSGEGGTTDPSASPSTSSSLSDLGVEDLSSGPKGSGQAVDGKGMFAKVRRLLRIQSSQKIAKVNPLLMNLDKVQLEAEPFVSIHVAVYNEKRVIERLIEACKNQKWQNYEVILADDSTDETTGIIKNALCSGGRRLENTFKNDFMEIFVSKPAKSEEGPIFKLIHRFNRDGFKGAALQKALENTNPYADFIVVFDSDFVPYADTVEQFMKSFQVTAGGLANVKNTKIAAIQGYQWHVLNKSENWVTRGVRTEYAGSYVIERAGIGIYGGLNMIAGSVFCLRADVLRQFGWGKSITEDLELTLRLYEAGFKVVFTPYIQAPAEAVSTIKRLIRQRMRWAEGHTFNIRKMWTRIFASPHLTPREKFEFLYLSPYYLQAAFFLVGSLAWFISEVVLHVRLPFWTAAWGWSLIFTNFLALPLMNLVGLFLEESDERDYLGIASFIVLSYILVPFQAYAAVKALIENEEGPWFRTPKTGNITDIFDRVRFYAWIEKVKIWRGKKAQEVASATRDFSQVVGGKTNLANLAVSSASYSSFNPLSGYKIRPKRIPLLARGTLAILLIVVMSLNYLAFFTPPTEANHSGNHLEQQVNIIDHEFSCSNATSPACNSTTIAPTDSRLGLVLWDVDVWTSPTVYFEAIIKTSDSAQTVTAALYADGDTTTAIGTVTHTGDTSYTRKRSSSVSLTDNTKYTARIKISNTSATASIKSARLIITQNPGTGNITNTETSVEVGNKQSGFSNTTYANLLAPKRYCFDVTQTSANCDTAASPSRWNPTPTAYFEASLVNNTAGVTTYAQLFQCASFTDCNTGTAVANSEVSVTGTTWTLARSASITLTAGKMYIVQIKVGSNAGVIANAKIILEQVDATNGITNLETVQMYNNTLDTEASQNYVTHLWNNEFTRNNFEPSGQTVSYFFESTISCSGKSCIGYYRLFNSTDSDPIDTPTTSTISTSPGERVRSANLASNSDFPAAGTSKDLTIQMSLGSGGIFANTNGSWLIVQIQNLQIPEVAILAAPLAFFFPKIARKIRALLKRRRKGKAVGSRQ